MSVDQRFKEIDWSGAESSLSENGFAPLGKLLTPDECASLIALYSDPERFRSRIDMKRFRFGRGEYQYFRDPLYLWRSGVSATGRIFSFRAGWDYAGGEFLLLKQRPRAQSMGRAPHPKKGEAVVITTRNRRRDARSGQMLESDP